MYHHHVVRIRYVEPLVISHPVHVLQIILVHRQIVDPNVLSTLIVHRILRVLRRNVAILVPVHVASMLNVEFKIIFQFVHVSLDSLGIHSPNVHPLSKLQYLPNRLIHVIHHHVVAMLNAAMAFALVYRNIKAIRIEDVDRNVP